ncbi:threonine dehydrogenase [Alicyclobacillus acidoterrestris]|uniref:zinc-dependent alcohol dehydrogenase n=1 Tax=Alicyclobacillus suci TaxID=2816080 RepID=UPI0011962CE0|nr:zinc-binding dehydrogenase [Alicyclobacillus suci]GEO27830.1 threonine dehydrogenase [Alicyclobacillus acidoterrestris]
MKAAIYHGKNDVRVEERDIPKIGSKDILVKNLYGGICGTDINIVKVGSEMGIRFGREFGHEMAGIVAEVGRDVVKDIHPGILVGVNPVTAKRVGRRWSLECGAFSQYVVVEDAELNVNFFKFDSDVSAKTAALMEPVSVGRHGAFSVNPQPHENIVVLGAGPIGLSAVGCLLAEDIKNVCVVDVDHWRLQKAAELGAKTINTAEENLSESLSKHFGEVDVYGKMVPDVDAFIDAAGASMLFERVLDIVKPHARIAVVAVYKQAIPVGLAQVMSKEVQIIGASGYTTEDILRAVEHLSNPQTKLDTLITHVFKLDEVQQAFEVAIDARETVKVLIELHQQ